MIRRYNKQTKTKYAKRIKKLKGVENEQDDDSRKESQEKILEKQHFKGTSE